MSAKAALLGAIAGRNRGLLAKDADKVALLGAIERLEDANPTPAPLQRPDLLDGDWRLLYTTSKELLGLDRVPLLQPGQIYQCVRAAEQQIVNIAEIVGVPFLEGLVTVVASFEIVSPKRANVRFARAVFGLQRLLQYEGAAGLVDRIASGQKLPPLDFDLGDRRSQGWLEITYLDADLRVGRGNQGSIFVLAKA
ncbi:MAG: PAP/fibrillin family protein [Cyanobacteria bacterium J06641_5]